MDPTRLNQAVLDGWQGSSSHFGFQVTCSTPDGGWTISHNPRDSFNISSAIKPVILAGVLRQVEAGQLRLGQQAAIRSTDRVVTSEVTDAYPDGSTLTLRALAEAMIETGDNTATEVLLRLAGKDAFERLLGDFGLTSTRFPCSLRRMLVYSYGMPEELAESDSLSRLLTGRAPDPNRMVELYSGRFGQVSSPQDLVRFYDLAFSGRMFAEARNLDAFRNILRLEDKRQKISWPPGVNCYRKGGNLELPPFYGASLAGCVTSAGERYSFAFCMNCSPETPEALDAELDIFRSCVKSAFYAFREG